MKKILLVLSVFVLLSCEQEDLNNLVDNSKVETGQQSAVKGRAASTIADFDPITELKDIPVNIINVGNTKNKYLSCVKDGNKVDLYNKDDNSLRQRWYINNGGIYLVGGHNLSNSKTISIFTDGLTQESSPVLTYTTPSKPWEGLSLSYQWWSVGSSYYNIIAFPFGSPNITKYMQSESNTSSSLLFKTTNTGALAQWEIKPVGDFELLEIAYAPYTGGKLDSIPQEVSIRTVDNSESSIPIEKSFTENVQVTETARYSKTEGVSFTSRISTTKSLAGSGEPKENAGTITIDNSMTTSWSYTQETTQTKTTTRTDNFKVTIPAYTKYTVTTYINQYSMNIKYVATLRATNGKEFKVKGTWSGTSCYEMFQKVKEEKTGKTFIVYGENTNKY